MYAECKQAHQAEAADFNFIFSISSHEIVGGGDYNGGLTPHDIHMGKTLHFKSREAYDKYAAYGNIHGVFKKTPGNEKIVIRGKIHKVKHLL